MAPTSLPPADSASPPLPLDPDRPTPPARRSSSVAARPRGILKHPSTDQNANAKSLLWNEENLAVNELAKDSTMKITEPKTPYVRYNAETDEVMDLDKIPGFELGKAEDFYDGGPPSPARTHSNPSSLSGSNPASRRGSEASEKMVKVEVPPSASGDEDNDDEMADEETLEHRMKFKAARGNHYKNEAEAMKRAQALLDEEESASSGPDVPPPVLASKSNGA